MDKSKYYKSMYFIMVIAAFSLKSYGQAQDQRPDDPNLVQNNAMRKDVVKISGVTNETQIQTGINAQTPGILYGGLGRPLQRITQQGSPLQKDLVQFMVYDQYGRQPKQYLPYTASTNSGAVQDKSRNRSADLLPDLRAANCNR